MQTVAVGSDQMSTQTDSSQWMQSSDTQTNSAEWSCVIGIQTDQSQWLHCEATQTDAGIKSLVSSTQTDWQEWLNSANVQTDCSYWQSSVSAQTDVKPLSSTAAQTKEKRIEQTFDDVAIETQANLATQVTLYCTYCFKNVGCQWHSACDFCNLTSLHWSVFLLVHYFVRNY